MRKTLWQRWKRLAHRAAEIQSIIVLALLYWIAVVPVGLLRRRARRRPTVPKWMTRAERGPVTVEDARRQF